jgi:hypothetical protein
LTVDRQDQGLTSLNAINISRVSASLIMRSRSHAAQRFGNRNRAG